MKRKPKPLTPAERKTMTKRIRAAVVAFLKALTGVK